MIDDDIRSLEHAFFSGDESMRPRLHAAYQRAGSVEALEEELLRVTGSRILLFGRLSIDPHEVAMHGSVGEHGTPAQRDKATTEPFAYLTSGPMCVRSWFAWQILFRSTDRSPRPNQTVFDDGDRIHSQNPQAHGTTVLQRVSCRRCFVLVGADYIDRSLIHRAKNDRTRLERLLKTWHRKVMASTPLVALWAGLTCEVFDAHRARMADVRHAKITDPAAVRAFGT